MVKLSMMPKNILAVLDYIEGIKYGDKICLNGNSKIYDENTMTQEEFNKRIDQSIKQFRKILHHREC